MSRLVAQQHSLDVTANNIANANTPGFKTQRVIFSDWLSKQTRVETPSEGQNIAYTQDRATYRDQQSGTIKQTGNTFDLALTGEGYFTVDTARGPRLTRAGHFTPMADGKLGDADGNALLDISGQPLRISANDAQIVISSNGVISSENGPLGAVGVVRPVDANALIAEGNRLLRSDGPTLAVKPEGLLQGAVEDSNVVPVLEMTRMMAELREFQFTSQFVQSEADRQQSSIDKITQRKA